MSNKRFNTYEDYIKYVLLNKDLLNESELEDYNIFYKLLCDLLPEEAFLEKVNEFGGLESVELNPDALAKLCMHFNVKSIAVYLRIRVLEKKYNVGNNSERRKEFDIIFSSLLDEYSDLFENKNINKRY